VCTRRGMYHPGDTPRKALNVVAERGCPREAFWINPIASSENRVSEGRRFCSDGRCSRRCRQHSFRRCGSARRCAESSAASTPSRSRWRRVVWPTSTTANGDPASMSWLVKSRIASSCWLSSRWASSTTITGLRPRSACKPANASAAWGPGWICGRRGCARAPPRCGRACRALRWWGWPGR